MQELEKSRLIVKQRCVTCRTLFVSEIMIVLSRVDRGVQLRKKEKLVSIGNSCSMNVSCITAVSTRGFVALRTTEMN